MKRNMIVAGNWKMNKDFEQAEELIIDLLELIEESGKPLNTEVILFPPAIYLELAGDLVHETALYFGAQNVSQFEYGAYTGEVSAPMLRSMGVDYCLVGHSERRKYFGEKDALLSEKIKTCLKNDIIPVYCCGESLADRESGKHTETVSKQLEEALFCLDATDLSKVIIAYEPVWAIGTGVNATPAQAQEMHEFIRQQIAGKFGKTMADEKIILYGGSCNSRNAGEIFAQADVDGGLIGGASLEASEFYSIIQAAR